MQNLFDMMTQAQNGRGMEALARQFNLSREQAQAAVEALLPAFSQGLKRNTTDPYGIGSFLNALASGQHARYFEDASRAFSPQGVEEGNGILGHLFGSKDLSRAVAAQAAQVTGLSQQLLQQMLPVIASMLMGGLFKQSTGQMQAAGGFGDNPLGQIIEEMMKQAGGGNAGPQGGDNPPGDNPFGKILQDMFGGGQASPQTRQQTQNPAQNPFGNTPWGKILTDMLGGAAQGAPEAQPQPRKQPQQQNRQADRGQADRGQADRGQAKNPYGDLFGQMFETGRQQRDEYQKGVESIFDQFLRGMDRNR